MTNLLQTGASWLAAQLAAHAATAVTYRRDWREVTVNATLGRIDADQGTERIDREIILPAASLVLSGETVTPEVGDCVVIAGEDYEVRAPAGLRPWRWCDPHQTLLRVRLFRDGHYPDYVQVQADSGGTVDAHGNTVETWATAWRGFALVRPLTGAEYLQAQQVKAGVTYRVSFPESTNSLTLTGRHRVIWRSTHTLYLEPPVIDRVAGEVTALAREDT